MRTRFLYLLVLLAFGCETGLNGPAGNPCPFIIDSTLGFSISLPCDAVLVPSTEPSFGLLLEELYKDADGNIYSIEVAPPGGAGVTIGDQGNLRFEGTMQTASGDVIVLGTLRLDVGDLFRAIARLSNGGYLRVSVFSVTRTQDQNRFLFGTIDLKNTNGLEGLTEGTEGAPKLLSPFFDEYLAIDNGTIWYVRSADKLAVLHWKAGDRVFLLDAIRFARDAFVTRIPDWFSVPVDFVGMGETHTVIRVTDFSTCAEVELSNGAIWAACTDRNIILGLTPGDVVIYFRDLGIDFLLQQATGKTALVVP